MGKFGGSGLVGAPNTVKCSGACDLGVIRASVSVFICRVLCLSVPFAHVNEHYKLRFFTLWWLNGRLNRVILLLLLLLLSSSSLLFNYSLAYLLEQLMQNKINGFRISLKWCNQIHNRWTRSEHVSPPSHPPYSSPTIVSTKMMLSINKIEGRVVHSKITIIYPWERQLLEFVKMTRDTVITFIHITKKIVILISHWHHSSQYAWIQDTSNRDNTLRRHT